jgi:hypothetical protein
MEGMRCFIGRIMMAGWTCESSRTKEGGVIHFGPETDKVGFVHGDDSIGGIHDEPLGIAESGDDDVVFFPFVAGGGEGLGIEAFDEGEGFSEVSALGALDGDEDGAALLDVFFEEGSGIVAWGEEEGLEALDFGDSLELEDGVSVFVVGRMGGEDIGFGERFIPIVRD